MDLSKFSKDKDGIFEGKVQGLGLGSVQVHSVMATSKENKTYYRLIANDVSGDQYEVGSMWPKIKDGLEYFSVSLDSPFFPEPINAALFPDKNEPNAYRFVWQRQRPAQKAQASQTTAPESLSERETATAMLGTTDLRNGEFKSEPKTEAKAEPPRQKRSFLKMQPQS